MEKRPLSFVSVAVAAGLSAMVIAGVSRAAPLFREKWRGSGDRLELAAEF